MALQPVGARPQGGVTVYDPRRGTAVPFTQGRPAATSASAQGQRLLAQSRQSGSGDDDGGGFPFAGVTGALGWALKPLEVLDLARRGVAVASTEFAKAVPDPLEVLWAPSLLIDEERARADTRGVMERMGDATYGWGDLLPQFDQDNFWGRLGNKATGFAGDVAFDPLTYLTFGAAPAVKGTATVGKAARAVQLSKAAGAARAAGELTPEMVQAMRRVAVEGFGAADDKLLDLMGMRRAGARLEVPFTNRTTGVVPFTGGAARMVQKPGRVIRKVWNEGKFGQRAGRAGTPRDQIGARNFLFGNRGTDDDFLAALSAVRMSDDKRRVGGVFKGLASAELGARTKAIEAELNDVYKGDMAAYLRATEMDPNTTTELNQLGERLREVAAELGVEIPELQGMGYLPHILSQEFRALLSEGDDAAVEFMRQSGLYIDDTLRESGYLQQRRLRPDPGTTLKLKIRGREAEIKEGSIAEINAAIAHLFPELKGTALETSPSAMFERYITGVAEDVGGRGARQTLIAEGDPFVRAFDQSTLGQQRQVEYGSTENPWAADPFLAAQRDEELSEAANTRIGDQAVLTIADQRLAADTLREQAAEGMSAVRSEVRDPLIETSRAFGKYTRLLRQRMDEIRTRSRSLGQQRRLANVQYRRTVEAIDAEMKQVKAALRTAKRDIVNMSTDQRRAYLADLRQRHQALQADLNDLNQLIGESSMWPELAEIRRVREDLMREVNEQQRFVDELHEALLPSKPTTDELMAIADQRVTTMGEGVPTPGVDVPYAFGRPVENQVLRQADVTGPVVTPTIPPQARLEPQPPALAAERQVGFEPPPGYVEAMQQHEALLREAQELLAETRPIRTAARQRAGIERGIVVIQEDMQALAQKLASGEEMGAGYIHAIENRIQSHKRRLTELRRELKQHRSANPRIAAKGAKAEAAVEAAQTTAAAARPLSPANEPTWLELLDLERRKLAIMEQGAERTPTTWEDLARLGMVEEDVARLFPELTGGGRPVFDFLHEVPLLELTERRRNELLANPDMLSTRRKAAEITGGLAKTTAEIESNLAGTGPKQVLEAVERSRLALADQGAADDLAALASRKARATQGLEDDVAAIDAEQHAGRAEFAQLMNSDAAFQQARAEAQEVARRSPTDPLKRLRSTEKNPNDLTTPVVYGLRPERKVLRDLDPQATPTEDLVKAQPLNENAEQIESMLVNNPFGDDATLRAAEAMLHQHQRQLQAATLHDIKAEQAQQVLTAASKGEFVDVVVSVLDRHKWEMMPEGDVVMATELARMMRNVAKVKAEPKLLGATLTAFTNFFKTYATLTPGFHVRNAISAVFMNSADGVSLANTKRGVTLWHQFMQAKDPLKFMSGLPEAERRAFEAVFGTGAGGRFLDSGVAEATAIGRTQLKEGIFRNKATLWSQRQGQRVEGAVRLGMALDTIANGGDVRDAITRITRIHFDYSQVSEFDEAAKRVIPFWTFMSRNMPMQLTQMWLKPRAYAKYNSFARNFSVEPDQFTPEYILQGGGWDTGAETPELPGMAGGMPVFLSPDLAFNRVEEDVKRYANVLGDPAGVLSDVNPFFTAPMEYASGRNFFTGQVYEDDDLRPATGLNALMIPFLAPLGQVKPGPNGPYITERGANLLQSLNPLLDRGVRLSGGNDPDRQAEAFLRLLGAPIRTVSEKQMESQRRSAQFDEADRRAMERALAG